MSRKASVVSSSYTRNDGDSPATMAQNTQDMSTP
ncbi:Uncharacterised protein [Mycobacteroides abscessus subsp. abscessus]|nr:Uncharacterised protein [Mycobacteroides abscessus subsp. abscessus]